MRRTLVLLTVAVVASASLRGVGLDDSTVRPGRNVSDHSRGLREDHRVCPKWVRGRNRYRDSPLRGVPC